MAILWAVRDIHAHDLDYVLEAATRQRTVVTLAERRPGLRVFHQEDEGDHEVGVQGTMAALTPLLHDLERAGIFELTVDYAPREQGEIADELFHSWAFSDALGDDEDQAALAGDARATTGEGGKACD